MSEPVIENTNQEKNSEVKSDQLKLEDAERNSNTNLSVKKLPEFNEENRERSNLHILNYIFYYPINS